MDGWKRIEDQWPLVLTLLPHNLEQTAYESEAIVRRRIIKDASTLLRLIFAYSWGRLSARQTCNWASISGICSMSNVALLERLQFSAKWLAMLVTQMLQRRCNELRVGLKGRCLRLVDASCMNRAGTKGTDKRLHLGFCLSSFCIDSIELTDSSGGETLSRFKVDPNDVIICDRGYAHRGGIWSVVKAGADVLVRINWQNLPLVELSGQALDIMKKLRSLKDAQACDWDVKISEDRAKGIPSIVGRLVAIRKSKEYAERERCRIRKQAKKKGKTPDARTLESADYIFLFATLTREEASAEDILQLYRFRWQIEVVFKRLKSLLYIDELPACSDELMDTVLLSRLLGALVIEDLMERSGAFSPWGYGLPAPVERWEDDGRYSTGTDVGGVGDQYASGVA